MTVYDQVEKLLKNNDDRPIWVDEILFELREIKRILKKNSYSSRKNRQEYFKFVNYLRDKMRSDMQNDLYPEIHYKNRILGMNLKGYFYDKSSLKDLSAHEAFEVYRFLYNNRKNLEKYIIK